jgi:hypothetical protein
MDARQQDEENLDPWEHHWIKQSNHRPSSRLVAYSRKVPCKEAGLSQVPVAYACNHSYLEG